MKAFLKRLFSRKWITHNPMPPLIDAGRFNLLYAALNPPGAYMERVPLEEVGEKVRIDLYCPRFYRGAAMVDNPCQNDLTKP